MPLHGGLSTRYVAAFALLQRMVHFVQTYQHYMMFEVLDPNWHILERNLKTVRKILLRATPYS